MLRTDKMVISFEVEGLEKLEKLKEEMELIEDRQSVFKVEMGSGMSFEGTKSDFQAYIKGVKELHTFTSKFGF